MRLAPPRRGAWLGTVGAVTALVACGQMRDTSDAVGIARQALLGTEIGVFVPLAMGTPSPRAQVTFVFDAARHVGVLFGGSNGSPLNETWEWGGTGWARRCDTAPCNTQTPAARSQAASANSSSRAVTVLFGGTDGGTSYCDTWEWTGTAWEPKLSPADCTVASPRERTGHAMADYGSHGAVLFGGIAGGAFANDLFGWNGTAWTALCTGACAAARKPSGRYASTLVHDTTHDTLLLFGGRDGASVPLKDLWEYDGAADTWTELCTGAGCQNGAPAGRFFHGAAFDSTRGRLVVHGGCSNVTCNPRLGDVYEWDGTGWSPSTPGQAKSAFGMAFDTERNQIVEYGGIDASTARLDATVGYYTRGASCSTSATCDTGQCVDGVCCESSACSTCERCNGTGSSAGICTPVTNADDDTCGGTSTCDASGLCRKKNGQGCSAANTCASGFCADDHCCNAACTGSCLSCGNASGTCTGVTGGTDPDSCAAPTLSCDGVGVCKKANGQQCSDPAQCASGNCVDGTCCNTVCSGGCDVCSDGTCTVLPAQSVGVGCGRYRCGGAAVCPANGCSGDADCSPGNFCNGGSCLGQKAVGVLCAANSECEPVNGAAGGYCVDGVCCGTECTGRCSACSAALKESGVNGECGPSRAGTDPDGECAEEPKTGCGQDGLCDGAGKCEPWPNGTDCSDVPGTNICVGTHAVGHVCDAGTCSTDRAGTDCSPGKCQNGTCPGCANSRDCLDSAYCRSGRCVTKRAQGATCSVNDECAQGFCVDGVCCVSVCNLQCEWCGDPAKAGECVPVVGAPKPGRNSCGGDGACTGACDGRSRDGCTYPSSATSCEDARCIGDWRIGVGRCDGQGLCAVPDAADCGASTCRAGECTLRCAVDTDCARGAACDPTSGACSSEGAECVGGFSVKSPHGTVSSCGGFRCEGTSCRYQCTADSDCAPGYSCGPRGCARIGGDAGILAAPDSGVLPPTGTGQKPRHVDAGQADSGSALRDVKASGDGGCGCRTVATFGAPRSPRERVFGFLAMSALAGLRRRARSRRSSA